jgi:hypothetical protein
MECNVKLELIHLRQFFPQYFHADTPAPTSHEQQEQTWLQLNSFKGQKVKGWKMAFGCSDLT